MLKSTKLPGVIATLPLTLQEGPEFVEHVNAVSAMLLASPERSVTVTGFDCDE
jgi:hypothetical protein